MENKVLIYLSLFCLMLTALSCSEEDDTPTPQVYEVVTDHYTFYSNPDKYTDINSRRASLLFCAFEWQIEKISRTADIMEIEVDIPASCEVAYELIWNGSLNNSNSPVANVFLNIISQECQDEDDRKTEVWIIDL